MSTLSIVIPALNEESGIQDIMARVLAADSDLAAAGVTNLELIVVDDGSTDRTADLVTVTAGVRLIRHTANCGYGAALKSGFAVASGEWIGFLDADGTYPPEHFPALCQTAFEHEADIVVGSRMASTDSQMPIVRRIGNLIFARLVSLLSAQAITDSASGMRIFKRAILTRIYPLPDGLNLTPVMSIRALHEQLKMIEVPISYSERVGRSKLNAIRDGVIFAQSIVWTALHYNPVRPLGMVGLTTLVLAVLIGLGLIAARLQGITTVGPLGAFTLFAALFHKQPIRQGLFRRPLFKKRLGRYLGGIGLVGLVLGLGLGVISLALGLQGWSVSRLWIYYLVSASLSLVGVQLMIAWVQMQILDALKARDNLIASDLRRDYQVQTQVQPQAGGGYPGQIAI